MNNNPRLQDLHFLNCNIKETVYGNIYYQDGIKVRDYAHALELFEEQQQLFRLGEILEFSETGF